MTSLSDDAGSAIGQLRSRPDSAVVATALALLEPLRNAREFGRLGDLAEALSRVQPQNPEIRVHYAQSLVETGRASAAIDVLQSALRRPGLTPEMGDELWGLVGRANKQIYIDAVDRGSDSTRAALSAAIAAYRIPYEHNPSNVWHAINLAAVLYAARRGGAPKEVVDGLDGAAIAQGIQDELARTPAGERDSWWSAIKAEAHIALGEWKNAEAACHDYITAEGISAFNIASTLRQLREVWEIQREGPEGAGLLQLLEARLASLDSSLLELRPGHVRLMRTQVEPTAAQLERVLGSVDARPLRWYRRALDCAASVAAVRRKFGDRFGTAFAVAASDFGLDTAETLVLTNFHVVNRAGAEDAAKPGSVEVAFEAAGEVGLGPYPIAEIIAESPVRGGLDYALLRLVPDAKLPAPLRTTPDLPAVDGRARVSVIGHPNAAEIHLALEDNELLDHEGPPDGKPAVLGRVRVHYRTPTSPGSSGSPVFDSAWHVIALHHAGSRYEQSTDRGGLQKLNGQSERYSANEGMWIGSIAEDVARQVQKSSGD